jgi:hypothetical protein
MIQTRGNITLLHVMFSGSTEVGKRALLSQLIKLQPSPTALFQPPTAVTTENPSTGVAEKVLPVIQLLFDDSSSDSEVEGSEEAEVRLATDAETVDGTAGQTSLGTNCGREQSSLQLRERLAQLIKEFKVTLKVGY